MNSAIQHARDKGSKGKTKRAWKSAILCAANFRLDDTDASGVPLGSSRNILCAVMPVIIIIFRHGRVGFTRSVDPRSLSPLACRSSCSRRTASLHCTHIYIPPCPLAADNPSVLTRPPGGLGRGRVCSIDRRRSAKLAERDRAPSWRRTSRISPFACHPPFRKSSYPLLDLAPSGPVANPPPSPRAAFTVLQRRGVSPFVPRVVLGSHHSKGRRKRMRTRKHRLFGIVARDKRRGMGGRRATDRRVRECDGMHSRWKS